MPAQGGEEQVDPIQPTLKAPVSKSLTLKYDKLLSDVAFKLLRHYMKMFAELLSAACECLTTVRRWGLGFRGCFVVQGLGFRDQGLGLNPG